jgi:hypothetical protein
MARRKKQNEDQSEENLDNNDLNNNTGSESDDTFGLPEVEYQPLNREEQPVYQEPVAEEQSYAANEEAPRETYEERESIEEPAAEQPGEFRSTYSYMNEDKPELWPKILGFALIFIVAAAIIWFFVIYQPAQKEKAELARKAEQERLDADRRKEAERLADLKRQEAEQRRLDSLANVSKVGVIETLSERTGRYYVVVASDIDDDLLIDYGNKLVQKGLNCKIIPPFGKTKFHRLAIDDKDTYADAQSAADGLKGGDYGDQLWVVKY